MKFPEAPPPLRKIPVGPDRLLPALEGADTEAMRRDRYLHWDELRHRQPPVGLSVEEWWYGLKMRRMAQRQVIPLKDRRGRAFSFSLTPRMFELLHGIDLRCGGSAEGPEPETWRRG